VQRSQAPLVKRLLKKKLSTVKLLPVGKSSFPFEASSKQLLSNGNPRNEQEFETHKSLPKASQTIAH
jgi:hypothetical protein